VHDNVKDLFTRVVW